MSQNGHKGIERLLALNKEHSRVFGDPSTVYKRRKYRVEHKTEIAVLKCMDGRLHLPVMTETELGIIQPWRNLGGKFDLGWMGFQQSMKEFVHYAISKGRNVLIFVTFHWSRGDKHRGCRGFNYEFDDAFKFALKLKQQFDTCFGKGSVYTILCGIETDNDALVFYGDNGEVFDLSTMIDSSTEHVLPRLEQLYPDMSRKLLHDLMPLVKGNISHIAKVRAMNRPIAESEHREWALGIGRGFDWLHEINTALIIGPFDPNLMNAIETGANLLNSNIKEGRIDPNDGIVLMSCAPFYDPVGSEPMLAREKAKYLRNTSLDVIKEKVPDLMPHLQVLTGIVNMGTRELVRIDGS